MSRTIIVANRLPVSIDLGNHTEEILINESIGGLATGLKSVHAHKDSLWMGWSGLSSGQCTSAQKKQITSTLENDYRCLPIFLTERQIHRFYYGFCNKTIWPLFHYFPNMTSWLKDDWKAYLDVNKAFFKILKKRMGSGDTIWIHDYQLMLLPQMIREEQPDIKIGFFLHIPFPSFELFRLLPERETVLRGILGADLIGFHTYDYARHFLSSVRRLLGYENTFGRIEMETRDSTVDAFPMGVDYERYYKSGVLSSIQEGTHKMLQETQGKQVILSVDRLDYTKGIPERIKAYARFLDDHPEYSEKVHLLLIAAPSRTEVDTYLELKKEIEELVSDVNGRFGTIGWVPVWFFYQSFSFSELAPLYRGSDVLLVTPLRDGMNLVVKEFIASRTDFRGAVILSETAGAASELGESILVNPYDIQSISKAIQQALEMPVLEQIQRNQGMHERLKRYTVEHWAQDFLSTLGKERSLHHSHAILMFEEEQEVVFNAFQNAQNRLLIFDYDGTLTPLQNTPEEAVPSKELVELIRNVAELPQTTLIMASGRKREDLQSWFEDMPITLSAEHGLWLRPKGEGWKSELGVNEEWKDKIRAIIESFVDRTPKSFIEEKTLGLAWHYRSCDPEQATVRLNELRETLMTYVQNMNLCLLEGSKVLEVRDMNANKGIVVNQLVQQESWDFILCAGDDVTDEDMFSILPENAFSIKVGRERSGARFHVDSPNDIVGILQQLVRLA